MMISRNQKWLAIAICLTCLFLDAAGAWAREQALAPTMHDRLNPPQSASHVLQTVMQSERRSSYKPSKELGNTPSPPVQTGQRQENSVENALPLKPPRTQDGTARSAKRNTPTQSMTTVFGSLGIVLGLFFLFVWFSKRNTPRAVAGLPKEAVEVLGRVPSGSRQHMELVRLGNKLVFLSITASATTPLAEVTEPAEVERLTNICRDGRGGRMSSAMQALSRANT